MFCAMPISIRQYINDGHSAERAAAYIFALYGRLIRPRTATAEKEEGYAKDQP